MCKFAFPAPQSLSPRGVPPLSLIQGAALWRRCERTHDRGSPPGAASWKQAQRIRDLDATLCPQRETCTGAVPAARGPIPRYRPRLSRTQVARNGRDAREGHPGWWSQSVPGNGSQAPATAGASQRRSGVRSRGLLDLLRVDTTVGGLAAPSRKGCGHVELPANETADEG